MTLARRNVQDFSLANKIYVNGIVTFYTLDANNQKSSTKATLYAAPSGTATLPNPQTLDSYGKLRQPVYVGEPVIATITGLGNTPDHDTGIIDLVTASSVNVVASGSSATRSLADRFGEVINVKDFEAVGDYNATAFSGTNDTAAIEAAFTYARSLAKPCHIYFPPGIYYTTGGHKVPANCYVGGAGMESTMVWFDQDVATTHCFFRANADTAAEFIGMGNMTISGSWQKTMSSDQRRDFTQFFNVTHLRFENLLCKDSRHFTMSGKYCRVVSFTDCWVERSARDAFNYTDCTKITVQGGGVRWCHDDAFAAHVSTAPGSLLTHEITINGFHMEDTNGIKLLGAKKVSITNCTSDRARGYACWVSWVDSTFNEGYTSGCSLIVANNTFNDTINVAAFGGGDISDVIILGSPEPTTGGGTIANIPWMNNTGTGEIIQHYPYLDNNGNSSSVIQAGGFDWIIQGNTCARTLKSVTSLYSELGRGLAYTQTGFQDIAVTPFQQTIMRGVRLAGSVKNCNIQGNIFGGCRRGGVAFDGGNSPSFAFMNVMINGNIFYDSAGVTNDFGTDVECDVIVINNLFDCDPFMLDSDRRSGGTWNVAGDSQHAGIFASRMKGVTVGGNHYRNCFKAIHTSSASIVAFAGAEILHCKPVATGSSSSNVGISDCPEASGHYAYVIEEGDPTSADYRKILNRCALQASAMPTTGIYVEGHFVRNTNATSITAGRILTGWLRLTTGSGHTLGTDWAAIYSRTEADLTNTFTWDPGSLSDGAGETSSAVTVSGAALGDMVIASAPYDLQGITCTAYVSATNTVRVRLQNETGGTIDLASGTWRVRVIKQ